ncbi:MAG: hypothetical protein Sapg2KO_42440 [Saprospiraceae bacterium]
MLVTFSCKQEPVEQEPFLQGRGYGFNSAVISVQNIDSTKKYFSEKLGFSFQNPDGFEKGLFEGTLSSTISFPNMSSIELLAVQDTIVPSRDSLMREFLKQKEGAKLYSISSSSIDSTNAWLTSQGFTMDSIRTYSKANRFSSGGAWDQNTMDDFYLGFDRKPAHFPQFAEFSGFPYERMSEWPSFYNMQRGFIKHPNGVLGITAAVLVVEDLKAAKTDFLKMGLEEMEENASEQSLHFKLKGHQQLIVKAPQSSDDEFSAFLEERGPGIIRIIFEVNDIKETHAFIKNNLVENGIRWDSISGSLTVLKDYAYGVNLEFIEEPKEQALAAAQLNLNFGGKLDSIARDHASGIYLQYCALCHGKDREGYVADNAPSLRSKSLLASSKGGNFLRYTIQYGRGESAMAGYYDQLGGPLNLIEIELLLKWLEEEAGIEKPVELSRDPVAGDIALGEMIYNTHCTNCHGKEGEGISAPALGNPMLLATATDDFLRYAIKEGRDGTPMVAYKDTLSEEEIDGVTAFLRSRASGWNTPELDSIMEPSPENYILNPNGILPKFELREGLYVSAEQLNKALEDSSRLVLLDARSKVAWRQTHIPGAIPVPYYEDPEEFLKHIPKDSSTMIVAYCACPHAASGQVISKLNKLGYNNTAILDEGILIWAQEGYAVKHGH